MKSIPGLRWVGLGMTMLDIDGRQKGVVSHFGFSFERVSPHCSRTIMLDELNSLFERVSQSDAKKSDYYKAIVYENCLAKRSVKTRVLTFRHLVNLYALDSPVLLFRALRFFWQRDPDGRALHALLCAYARDSVLRSATEFIINTPEGATVTREALEKLIDDSESGRFSQATLKSTAQNINASFTKSGHLVGKARKVRSRARATAGSTAYALFLGYLCGVRGRELFETEFAKLLDCPFDRLLELTEEASRKGWIVSKRIGTVIEVLFPNLITKEELERLYEQN